MFVGVGEPEGPVLSVVGASCATRRWLQASRRPTQLHPSSQHPHHHGASRTECHAAASAAASGRRQHYTRHRESSNYHNQRTIKTANFLEQFILHALVFNRCTIDICIHSII